MKPLDSRTAHRLRVWCRAGQLLLVAALIAAGLRVFESYESEIIRYKPEYVTESLLPSLALRQIAFADAVPGLPTPATAVPILLYHGLATHPSASDVTIDEFREQMTALRAAGYHTLSLAQFESFMRNGEAVPSHSVLVTFDDGRSDSVAPAEPILSALGEKATMFVIVNSMRSNNAFYVTEPEVRRMAAGQVWSIGSHTLASHGYVPIDAKGDSAPALVCPEWIAAENRVETEAEYERRVSTDLTSARDYLSRLTGGPVASFAFPFGNYGQRYPDVPKTAPHALGLATRVYPLVYVQANPAQDYTWAYPGEHQSLVRRIIVQPGESAAELLSWLRGGEPKPLPYDAAGARTTGWRSTEGTITAGAQGLLVQPSNRGVASGFLDGTRLWRDYSVELEGVRHGEEVDLQVRRAGPSSWITVEFAPGEIRVVEAVGDNRMIFAYARSPRAMTCSDMGVRVSGDTLDVSLGNKVLIVTKLPHPADSASGGLGLRVAHEDTTAPAAPVRFSALWVRDATGAVSRY
jgi:peptidoglycan/xylan/chitin deacetylase (PgdA/CDA1 family)